MLIVSHRGPFHYSYQEGGRFELGPAPGGVAATLRPLLARPPGDPIRCLAAAIGVDRLALEGDHSAPENVHLLHVEADLHGLHYHFICNQVLWFVLNRLYALPTMPVFDETFAEGWAAYVHVNRQFAECAADMARSGEMVLVNDYQLALVPGMLRELRPDTALVSFVHTPFPEASWLHVLPVVATRALRQSWTATPIGFHTPVWRRHFLDWTGARRPSGSTTFVAPLGPDPRELEELVKSPGTTVARNDLDAIVDSGRSLILRVERLDPSKNTLRGIMAFESLLASRARWRERAELLICLVPSRALVPAYEVYRQSVLTAVDRVNERFGRDSWRPVTIMERDDYCHSIAALERYDVLFINSIADGMNLVAKEGPLLNRVNGVLCLSPEAGAYEELRGACLRTHAFDIAQTAAVLDQALSMAPALRAAQAVQLRTRAAAHSPATWLAAATAAASAVSPTPRSVS